MNRSTIRKIALFAFAFIFFCTSCSSTMDSTARNQNATLSSRVDELASANSQLTAQVVELTSQTATPTTTDEASVSTAPVVECGPAFMHYNDQITILFNCDGSPSAFSVVACNTLTSFATTSPVVVEYNFDSTNASHNGDIKTSWEYIVSGILGDPRVKDLVMDTTGMVVELTPGLINANASDLVEKIAQGTETFAPCENDPYNVFVNEANQYNTADPVRCAELAAKYNNTLAYPDSTVTLPVGYFFSLDCATGYSGWWYQGAANDSWKLTVPTGVADNSDLPMTTSFGIPDNHQHPAYADALTISQIVPGMTICRRVGDRALGSFVVKDLVIHVADTTLMYAAWHETSRPGSMPWALDEDGVIPFENGLWSISRLTAGPC